MQVFDEQGAILAVINASETHFLQQPGGLAIVAGELYICDKKSNQVHVLALEEQSLFTAATSQHC